MNLHITHISFSSGWLWKILPVEAAHRRCEVPGDDLWRRTGQTPSPGDGANSQRCKHNPWKNHRVMPWNKPSRKVELCEARPGETITTEVPL